MTRFEEIKSRHQEHVNLPHHCETCDLIEYVEAAEAWLIRFECAPPKVNEMYDRFETIRAKLGLK